MYGPAGQTSASALGDSFDIWVFQTGKVTWRIYGDVPCIDMSAQRVTQHVDETECSESGVISGWANHAQIVMDY